MSIPPALLSQISSEEGGRVVLVIGAGCSFEEPTGLPLAGACSEEAHRRLVADNIIVDGECSEPWDLSALTDLVKNKCGGLQAELVRRLPITRFKTAKPNDGHKIAIALMVEGAITNVVTLNFDLAFNHAIAELGIGGGISIISGPDQHHQLSRSNVVYLHRSAEADPEQWVLTTEALETAWTDAWEELIARWALAAPVTVFAGLGSSCGVLRHTATKICSALSGNSEMFLANPGDYGGSTFATEMSVGEDRYVPLGWIDFMRDLGDRFHQENVAKIQREANELSRREGWLDANTNQPIDDLQALLPAISAVDLLAFGKMRSAWLLDSSDYPKIETSHINSIADLFLAVAMTSRKSGSKVEFSLHGHVILESNGQPPSKVRLIDGSSKGYRWSSLESRLRQQESFRRFGETPPKRILACGVMGRKPENTSPPISIVNGSSLPGSIVGSGEDYSFFDVDEIREDGSLLKNMLTG